MKKEKPENFRDFQKKVFNLLSEIRHPRTGAFLSLVEETGEACREIMELEIYSSKKNTKNLGNELADIQISLFEIASLYNLDLQTFLEEKIRDLKTRTPKWRKKYGKILFEKRKKMDD